MSRSQVQVLVAASPYKKIGWLLQTEHFTQALRSPISIILLLKNPNFAIGAVVICYEVAITEEIKTSSRVAWRRAGLDS